MSSIENLKSFGESLVHIISKHPTIQQIAVVFHNVVTPLSSLSSALIAVTRLTFLCSTDPFAEADEDTGETKQSQNYIHIRIQRKFTFSFVGVYNPSTAPRLTPQLEISMLTRFAIQSAMVVRL
jgi:hypothetical protein